MQVDLSGSIALLTGGRVRIGYQIALRLLRCGAECHVTSRFVSDAALRCAPYTLDSAHCLMSV
jgi:NAD(P)-dependent dehydrogenase (short-subunit alcohol dehydrogenase family)